MRVALVVPEYATEYSQGGGMATVAEFIRDALIAEGRHSVEFVSVRMSRRAGESRRLLAPASWRTRPILRRSVHEGTPVTYAGTNVAELEFVRYQPTASLTNHLNTFDLAVVVCGSPIAFSLLQGLRIPTAAQVATLASKEREAALDRSSLVSRWAQQGLLQIVRRSERRNVGIPDLVFVENTFMENVMREWGHTQSVLLPPGVDTDVFSPGAARQGDPYILSVGRLNDPRKNFGGLLKAYAEACERHPIQQRLILAGLYDLSESDRALIGRLGLEGRVEVVRNAERDELIALYRGADLFVLASFEEGLGLALIEAMACGTPVVTTATEGAGYVIGNSGAGRLVQLGPDLVADLTGAIVDELQMPNTQADPRERVLKEFSAATLAVRFREELEGLVARS